MPKPFAIRVIVDEDASIPLNTLRPKTVNRIDELVDRLIESKAKPIKNKGDLQNGLIELLENPEGLTKKELLVACETENLSSTVLRLRNILKKDNEYKLVKFTKNKTRYYKLERKF